LPIERLAQWDGPTWLDRQIAGEDCQPLRDAGFGKDVRKALELRRRWLLQEQLAVQGSDGLRLKPDALDRLRTRELLAAAKRFGGELGKPFADPGEGQPIAGNLVRRIDLASGRFALVENSREFTLVPWRAVLERHLGREISGVVRGGSVNWHLGKSRGLEL
jgi:hypothetical protein